MARVTMFDDTTMGDFVTAKQADLERVREAIKSRKAPYQFTASPEVLEMMGLGTVLAAQSSQHDGHNAVNADVVIEPMEFYNVPPFAQLVLGAVAKTGRSKRTIAEIADRGIAFNRPGYKRIAIGAVGSTWLDAPVFGKDDALEGFVRICLYTAADFSSTLGRFKSEDRNGRSTRPADFDDDNYKIHLVKID